MKNIAKFADDVVVNYKREQKELVLKPDGIIFDITGIKNRLFENSFQRQLAKWKSRQHQGVDYILKRFCEW